MSSSNLEVLFNPSIAPIYFTATNMVIPIGTISLLTIKNNLETKMNTILNIFNSNIYSIIAIILAVYTLYKLKKFL
jgi:hypothetical protein